jgi:hypothetical protein
MKMENYEQKLAAAVYEWRNLQDRKINPAGHFDKQGRFYLAEKFSCCAGIRTPSAAYPYSQMTHGRSMGHVAEKYGVDAKDMRRECRACSMMRSAAV